jgi:hypothetical protein
MKQCHPVQGSNGRRTVDLASVQIIYIGVPSEFRPVLYDTSFFFLFFFSPFPFNTRRSARPRASLPLSIF